MIPQSIKNLIFDFGTVIFDIDSTRTIDAFKALNVVGFDDFDDFLKNSIGSDVFTNLEKGLINPAEFHLKMCEWAGREISDELIDNAWNAMLVGYRKDRLDLLSSLNKSHRTFLLSNTNVIHWNYFTKLLFPFRYKGLHELFEKDYYSHELHMRKPDAKIYEYVIRDANIKPEETLFLDDLLPNVLAARSLGINAVQITNSLDIIKIFGDQYELVL